MGLPKPATKKTTTVVVRPGSPALCFRRTRIRVYDNVLLKDPRTGEIVGTAFMAEKPGTDLPAEILHGYALQELQREYARSDEHYVVVKSVFIDPKFADYPYTFAMKGAEVPEKLSDLYPQGRYVWDLNSCLRAEPSIDTAAQAQGNTVEPENVDRDVPVPSSPEIVAVPSSPDIEASASEEQSSKESGDEERGGDDLSEVPSDFDKSLYVITEMEVRIDQLVPFRSQARAVSSPHVESLLESFQQHGNDYGMGMISVGEKVTDTDQKLSPALPAEFWTGSGLERVTEPVVSPGTDEQYLKPFVVLNGLHRRAALMRMCTSCDPEMDSAERIKVAREFGFIRVRVVSRKDGRELSGYEVTVFGGMANEGTSRMRKPTFGDQLHLCMSFLQEILIHFPSKDVRAGNLASKLHAVNLIPSLSEITLVKYTRIAITFVKRPALYEVFYNLSENDETGGQLQLCHIQSAKFHNLFNEKEQIIVLQCLHEYQQQASLARTGSFTSPADSAFFQECRDKMDGLADIAVKTGCSMDQLWDRNVSPTRPGKVDSECSTMKWLVRSMARFDTKGTVKELEKRRAGRVRKFLATVRNAVYPDKTPKGVPTRSEPRPKRSATVARLSSSEMPALKRLATTTRSRASSSGERKTTSIVAPVSEVVRSGSRTGPSRSGERNRSSGSKQTPQPRKSPRSRKKPLVATPTKGKLSQGLNAGNCLQCNGETATVLTAPNGGEDHMLERIPPASRTRYEFDDDIPSEPPINSGTSDEWDGDRSWVNLLSVPPHRIWGGSNRIHHIAPWLRGMGVQDGHRSFYTLTTADLQRNHHAVYLHAQRLALKDPVMQRNPMCAGVRTDLSAEAMEWPELASWFLGKKKSELDNVGYCVLEGFFNDESISRGITPSLYDRNLVSELLDFYESIDHEAPRPSDPNVDTVWWEVKNDSEEDPGAVGKRYITSRYGVMEHVEGDASTSHYAALRAALDVRALQICVSLGLEEDGQQELAIPLSGSRIMTHSKGVKRQIAHTDFEITERAAEEFRATSNASYSVIWTGEDALPLVFWDSSHKYFQGPSQHSMMLAKVAVPRKVLVPPFSCVVLRGDVWHAGTGDSDITVEEKAKWTRRSLYRMHIYIGRQNMDIRPRPERTSYQVFFPSVIAGCAGFEPRDVAAIVEEDDEEEDDNVDDDYLEIARASTSGEESQ